MGSSPSKQKTGKGWTSKVYFDPEADGSTPVKEITDSELRTVLKGRLRKKTQSFWHKQQRQSFCDPPPLVKGEDKNSFSKE